MGLTHGMDIEAIEQIGARLQRHYAEGVTNIARDVGGMVGSTKGTWNGGDADRFRSWWPAKRAALHSIAEDLHGFGQAALNNVAEQRSASSEGATAGSHGRVGPAVVAIREEISARETKSGAVVRGVDGSELRFREMSDGTFEVVVTLGNGMTVDFGDAATLAQFSRGKFFSDGGVEWDFDASYISEDSTTFTFTDKASARAFFDGLEGKQDSLSSMVSGMTWNDVRGVARDLGGQLGGDVVWSGHHDASHFSAEGSFGFSIGESSSGGLGVGLSQLQGLSTETLTSGGSTGQLTVLSGSVTATGEIRVGDFTIDGVSTGEYERAVHLITDSSGVPIRLEVEEQFGSSASAGTGFEFLGTGTSAESGTVNRLVSTTVFDLTDPSVAATFSGDTGPDGLFAWSRENAQLGGQTVASYEGSSSSSSSSLLLSGEWTTADETSTLTGSSYRAPGSDGFEHYVGDMRDSGGMRSQIITEADGSISVVRTGTF